MSKEPRLLIVGRSFGVKSETFIDNHIEYLKGEKRLIYGRRWDMIREDGSYIWPYRRYMQHALSAITNLDDARWFKGSVKKVLEEVQPTAILAQFGPTGEFLAPAAKELKIPLFVHFHGFDISRYLILWRFRKKFARMAEQARGLFVVSEKMVDQLLRMGVSRDKIILNPYGVDPTLFEPKENISHSEPVFLMVGRLVAKKAPHLSIEAFIEAKNRVNKGDNELKLRIVGDGPLRKRCEALIQHHEMQEHIQILGFQSPEEVSRHMAEARAFVQHSVTAWDGNMEGLPLAIIEAQMSGKPVISTLHAGIPDSVAHGETGYLVPEKDVQGMTEYMIRLAEDRNLALEMGQSARARALEYFTLEKHIQGIQRHLDAL